MMKKFIDILSMILVFVGGIITFLGVAGDDPFGEITTTQLFFYKGLYISIGILVIFTGRFLKRNRKRQPRVIQKMKLISL